jgi:5'-3' exonuclease
MMSTDGPVLVLDSASLYYRSFHALPEKMTAPDGRPNNAVRGFLSTVARLVDAHAPAGLVACWDNDWRPAWRVELVPSYKAHRVAEGQDPSAEAEPESLTPQAEAIGSLLDALGIHRWGVDDYEADDVIGSVVAQSPDPCIVVSGDRDLVQVVDDRNRLLLTVNGGMDKWPLLDPDGVRERFDVRPEHYVDLAVLRGDPSDGLPGVSGIGAKTAAALVAAFGPIPAILEAARETPAARPMTARLAEALIASQDAVRRAEKVARVVTDLRLPGAATDLPPEPFDADNLDELGERWGVSRQVADLRAAIGRSGSGARQTADE